MRTFSVHEISTATRRGGGVSVLNILPHVLKTINCPHYFHTNQILCYSINLIYDLQAIHVFNIVTIDKNSPVPKYIP